MKLTSCKYKTHKNHMNKSTHIETIEKPKTFMFEIVQRPWKTSKNKHPTPMTTSEQHQTHSNENFKWPGPAPETQLNLFSTATTKFGSFLHLLFFTFGIVFICFQIVCQKEILIFFYAMDKFSFSLDVCLGVHCIC